MQKHSIDFKPRRLKGVHHLEQDEQQHDAQYHRQANAPDTDGFLFIHGRAFGLQGYVEQVVKTEHGLEQNEHQ